MISFENSIQITPPPYSDHGGNVITPSPIYLDRLEIVYIDDPQMKNVVAQFYSLPISVILWSKEQYDDIGDWTKKQAELRMVQLLGDNPAKFLRSLYPKTLEETPNHPGTILSKMIKSIGIQVNDNCSCKSHALEMNNKGNDWCEENIDLIVSWLKQEAKKRGLPFIDAIGKLLVNRAIKKSRKLLSNEPVPENDEDLDSI